MVAYAGNGVRAIWIGVDDKLPRMARAVFARDPLQLRHQVEFSNWQLGRSVPRALSRPGERGQGQRIPFLPPDPAPPSSPTAEGAPSKTQ